MMINVDFGLYEAAKNFMFEGSNLVSSKNSDGKNIYQQKNKPWKILIVDDDDVVHQVSNMVLADYSFDDRKLEVIHAYSGFECRRVMQVQDDIAVIIMDVVMETDSAGLDAINYIRNDLENNVVRIIVRTGQPGILPEQNVMAEYEIDAYLEKSDLTAQKLYEKLSMVLTEYKNINNL